MHEDEFLSEASEILDVDLADLTLETVFRESPVEFDSMKGMGLLTFIEMEGKTCSLEQFLAFKTLQDIFDYIQA